MGFFSQLYRAVKGYGKKVFRWVFRRKPKKDAAIVVPSSWSKPKKGKKKQKKAPVVISHKRRVPGLRLFNRCLAGLLLFVNFVFSQYLVGSQGIWMALFFFGNCYICLKYIWNSRKTEEKK